MTTIPIPAAVPDLPPLPIGALVACALDLMQETGDLPQPRYITIHDTQALGLQLDPQAGGLRAVIRWAAQFGSVLVSSPIEDEHGPATWCRTDFDYYGVAVHVYSVIRITEPGSGADEPAHADYPHEPGRLYGCPACEAACHCTPCGCGYGRTCSATAATSSPNPAATPSPSATSAANASLNGGSSATPTADATRGAAPSMTAWSWSSPTGPMPEPATPPACPPLSWRWRPLIRPALVGTRPPPRTLRHRQVLLEARSTKGRRSGRQVKLPVDCLWTVGETAQYLRVPPATLYQWRYLGIGPKSGRVGRYLRYEPAEVISWFRAQQEQGSAA